MKYEFSTKLNNRKNSKGVMVEKVRVWLEESTNNRFLSDNGFTRGASVDIFVDNVNFNNILIQLVNDNDAHHFAGKKAIVAGKTDRSLFDITRNADQMPESFHPKNNARLVATIEYGSIIIKVR